MVSLIQEFVTVDDLNAAEGIRAKPIATYGKWLSISDQVSMVLFPRPASQTKLLD